MRELKCMYCNRKPIQTPPGIFYIDAFYTDQCGVCGTAGDCCEECLTKTHQEKISIPYEGKFLCKSCRRDKKIDEVISS